MNAHIFNATAGSKSPCSICGKTRNTKEHKLGKAEHDAAVQQMQSKVDTDLIPDAEAEAETEAILADDEAVAAIAEAKAEVEQPEPVAKAKPAPKAKAAKTEATIWIGWRVANAVVLKKGSLAKKVADCKPTADLDRTVKLTVAELKQLDEIAASFMAEGKSGPEVYSGRALRGRVAKALTQLGE